MKSKIPYLKYYFVAAFAVISAGITGFEWLYHIPMKKCEAAGNWWSWKYRQCARPMNIVDMPGMKKRAEVSKTVPASGAQPPAQH